MWFDKDPQIKLKGWAYHQIGGSRRLLVQGIGSMQNTRLSRSALSLLPRLGVFVLQRPCVACVEVVPMPREANFRTWCFLRYGQSGERRLGKARRHANPHSRGQNPRIEDNPNAGRKGVWHLGCDVFCKWRSPLFWCSSALTADIARWCAVCMPVRVLRRSTFGILPEGPEFKWPWPLCLAPTEVGKAISFTMRLGSGGVRSRLICRGTFAIGEL